MERLRILVSRLRGLFLKRSVEESLDAELRSHLQMRIDEHVRRGMSVEEAEFTARSEFGGVEQAKQAYREQRGLPWVENLLQDIRFGVRLLRKSPGFTFAAVLILALGIGANSAAFSLVDTVLLRPLPYRDPERLLILSETLPQQGQQVLGVAAGEYLDYRDRNHCFSQVAAYESAGFNLTGEGTPMRVNAARLSASTFPMLGARALLGRTFTEQEDRYGAPNVALLSAAIWKNHYASDPLILGKIVKLDEQPYAIVGVMPESFRYPFDGSPLSERADLWVPETIAPERLKDRLREFGVHVIGRLKPEVTPPQAQADLEVVAANFMREHPEMYSGTIRVEPRTYGFASYSIAKAKPMVLLLQAAVLCILLIGCANVANLLLARAGKRSGEMALRRAIGAGRWRLLCQCMAESATLAVLGGAAGILLAVLLVDVTRRFGPGDVPQLQDVSLNPAVISFTLVLSLGTTLIFGIAPAWRLSNTSPQGSLKESTQIGAARTSQRLQNSLGVMEVGVALVLLICASLLLRSFVQILQVPMGFRPRGTVIARTYFDTGRYPDALKREAVQREILARLAALPGVSSAAAASHLPLSDARQIGFRLEHAAEDDYHWAENSLVSPGYFQAMGIPLVRGRDFTAQDDRKFPNVAIVNETFARQHLAGRDCIGQRFFWGGRSIFTIVGVAADVHVSALDADPPPMIYNSMFQIESGASTRTAFLVHLANSEAASSQELFEVIRAQLWSLDKDLPAYGLTTLDALVSESVAQRRFTVFLVAGFGLVGLLLAATGLFSVISYLVAQRTKELALRMALGADRATIRWMVLKHAARVGVAGCSLGMALFTMTSSVFVGTLFRVSRFDPPTLVIVPAMLLGIAMFAAYWPARRAVRVDPITALRFQ